jgi:hypothetical protein
MTIDHARERVKRRRDSTLDGHCYQGYLAWDNEFTLYAQEPRLGTKWA